MSTNFKVAIIHRETITPSSPTPPHLKTLPLSLLDQFMPEIYPPFIYFYPNHVDFDVHSDHHQFSVSQKCSILKASLSETLSHFYPFAGKFQYNDSIYCDDRGASFVEARVSCRSQEILESPDLEKLQRLFPAPVDSTQALVGYLVLAQLNLFECGGIAIALSISHKVADGFTAMKFMNLWTSLALIRSNTTVDHHHHHHHHPRDRIVGVLGEFGVAATLYPPQDFLNASKPVVELNQGEKCKTRRFVFDASGIDALKLKSATEVVPNPTRSEVVSALIWECAIEASRANSNPIRASVWRQIMNLRTSSTGNTENLMGNLSWYFEAKREECDQVDLQSLMAILRKCKEDYKVKYPIGVTVEDVCQTIKDSAINFGKEALMDCYGGTSLCRLPFYETNFGWGKPSWVVCCVASSKNVVSLMDAHDGNGIDAWITLLEEDMAIVESNQELLSYASLNPRVDFQPHRRISVL